MLFGMILAAFAGVIVPYLPTAGDDIAEMTQGIDAATQINNTITETRPVWADDAATFDDTPSDSQDPVLSDDIDNEVEVTADVSTTPDAE